MQLFYKLKNKLIKIYKSIYDNMEKQVRSQNNSDH